MRTRGVVRGLRRRPYWLAMLLTGCLLLVDGLHWRGLAGPPSAAPERGSPAARLLPGEFAYERWELTARFDSGHFFFTEFLITNFGFGDRNAALIGHVVQPDGTSRRFRTGRRESRWALSADRLRMEIGASWLDQRGPKNTLQVKKKRTHVALDFYPRGPALWSADFPPAGYAIDLLDPRGAGGKGRCGSKAWLSQPPSRALSDSPIAGQMKPSPTSSCAAWNSSRCRRPPRRCRSTWPI